MSDLERRKRELEKFRKKEKLAIAEGVLRRKKRPEAMTIRELEAVIVHYQDEQRPYFFAWAVLVPIALLFLFVSPDPTHKGVAGLGIILIVVASAVRLPQYRLKVRRLKKMLAQRTKTQPP